MSGMKYDGRDIAGVMVTVVVRIHVVGRMAERVKKSLLVVCK